jgi:two-component system, LytTR family, sensor histidine kinase AlgZ
MTSIKQNEISSSLPNFRNLGVMLRILVITNVAGLIAALIYKTTAGDVLEEFIDLSTKLQPILILSLLVLSAVNNWLQRLSYQVGIVFVIGLITGITILIYNLAHALFGEAVGLLERYLLFSSLITLLLLFYFNLRNRALSPAMSEARLQALQARIRPHFLFNSINAVLSLIRVDQKRAEAALENLADLFRVLMSDNLQLTTLAKEVELCRQYLDLELLRLGDRMKVEWFIDKMPGDALVPPLMLQPLLENAVYHGIEPWGEPGVINVNIYSSRDQIHAVLTNPYRTDGDHHAGNKMAMANIRERLSLHYDAEAALDCRIKNNSYQVHIVIPYVKASKS